MGKSSQWYHFCMAPLQTILCHTLSPLFLDLSQSCLNNFSLHPNCHAGKYLSRIHHPLHQFWWHDYGRMGEWLSFQNLQPHVHLSPHLTVPLAIPHVHSLFLSIQLSTWESISCPSILWTLQHFPQIHGSFFSSHVQPPARAPERYCCCASFSFLYGGSFIAR